MSEPLTLAAAASVAQTSAVIAAPPPLPQHANDYLGILSAVSSAVSTTATVASWAIVVFGTILALFAFFGWLHIRKVAEKTARKTARKMAQEVLEHHLQSEHLKNTIDAAVAAAVQSGTASAVVHGATGIERPIGARLPPAGGKP